MAEKRETDMQGGAEGSGSERGRSAGDVSGGNSRGESLGLPEMAGTPKTSRAQSLG